jgi:hypothetical protein
MNTLRTATNDALDPMVVFKMAPQPQTTLTSSVTVQVINGKALMGWLNTYPVEEPPDSVASRL